MPSPIEFFIHPFRTFGYAQELGRNLTASLKDFEQILKSRGVDDTKTQLEIFQAAFDRRYKAVRARLSQMSMRRADTENREYFVEVVVLYFEGSSDSFEKYFEENNTEDIAQSLAYFLGSIRYGVVDYHFIGAEEVGIDSRAAAKIKQSVAKIIAILRKKTGLTTLTNIQARLNEMLNDKKLFTTRQTRTTQLFRDIIYEIL